MTAQSGHQLRKEWYEQSRSRLSQNQETLLSDSSWRRFAVVRSPYTRTISSYYLSLVNRQWQELKPKVAFPDDERRVTIPEFLDFLEMEDLETCNIHWRQRTAKACWTNAAAPIEIVRTEILNSQLCALTSELGASLPIQRASATPMYEGSLGGLDLLNMTRLEFLRTIGTDFRNGKITFPALENFLAPETRIRIKMLYGRDISQLGYADISINDPHSVA